MIEEAKPGTLRAQVRAIGAATVSQEFVDAVSFPAMVYDLAAKAFIEQWRESPRTRAVRMAATLLTGPPGYVSPDEPEVK